MTKRRYSTSTLIQGERLVPWLAAEGPLAYTPESPPERDSLFQYGWVLPQVCQPGLRRHTYFGALQREAAGEIFAFWQAARRGKARRVAYHEGELTAGSVNAPIAVYEHDDLKGHRTYVFIQHGSYQCIPVEDQPELEAGYVHVHRGIGDAEIFRFWPGHRSEANERCWGSYAQLQLEILAHSDISFNSIHDRTRRVETGHLRDGTSMSDELARDRGLDIDREGWTRALWQAAHQSFSMRRWVSESKFGPHRVVCRTPLTNIRITTFFAGEHELRIIDPARLQLLEAVGCEVSFEEHQHFRRSRVRSYP